MSLSEGHNLSLEDVASSAKPALFHPDMLPPFVPAGRPAQNPPASLHKLLHDSADQEQTLGFTPTIGRRAALHYGLDRRVWERQAALRMM